MDTDIYNVHSIESNTELQSWTEMSPYWLRLGVDVGANSEFSPLTLKALYITGLIIGVCKSVNILLNTDNLISTTYYPAYGVFASAIDLLGRCLRGNETNRQSNADITEGFKWLASPNFNFYEAIREEHILVSTINYTYTISELVGLRHFAAHGQGVNKPKPQDMPEKIDGPKIKDFDYLILAEMPLVIGDAMQAYLREPTFNESLAKSLAKVLVTPYRNRPIFDALWGFQATRGLFPQQVSQALSSLDWTCNSGLINLGKNAA